mmetsp:Transcript_18358/g.53652  ORF Transcript_18358/g.53652 Transcript_18358/m.53652 type:complete len:332 (+) Transcript_18358:562-1557(+)
MLPVLLQRPPQVEHEGHELGSGLHGTSCRGAFDGDEPGLVLDDGVAPVFALEGGQGGGAFFRRMLEACKLEGEGEPLLAQAEEDRAGDGALQHLEALQGGGGLGLGRGEDCIHHGVHHPPDAEEHGAHDIQRHGHLHTKAVEPVLVEGEASEELLSAHHCAADPPLKGLKGPVVLNFGTSSAPLSRLCNGHLDLLPLNRVVDGLEHTRWDGGLTPHQVLRELLSGHFSTFLRLGPVEVRVQHDDSEGQEVHRVLGEAGGLGRLLAWVRAGEWLLLVQVFAPLLGLGRGRRKGGGLPGATALAGGGVRARLLRHRVSCPAPARCRRALARRR